MADILDLKIRKTEMAWTMTKEIIGPHTGNIDARKSIFFTTFKETFKMLTETLGQ